MRLNSTLNPTVASELPFLGISFFRENMVLWALLAPRGPYGAPLQGAWSAAGAGQRPGRLRLEPVRQFLSSWLGLAELALGLAGS